MRSNEHFIHVGEKKKFALSFGRKPEGKRPFGRPRHRREGSIRINLKYKEWEGMDWIYLPQNMNRDTIIKNAMLWFVIPCNSQRYRRFG
jgi:hypothetical protein